MKLEVVASGFELLLVPEGLEIISYTTHLFGIVAMMPITRATHPARKDMKDQKQAFRISGQFHAIKR